MADSLIRLHQRLMALQMAEIERRGTPVFGAGHRIIGNIGEDGVFHPAGEGGPKVPGTPKTPKTPSLPMTAEMKKAIVQDAGQRIQNAQVKLHVAELKATGRANQNSPQYRAFMQELLRSFKSTSLTPPAPMAAKANETAQQAAARFASDRLRLEVYLRYGVGKDARTPQGYRNAAKAVLAHVDQESQALTDRLKTEATASLAALRTPTPQTVSTRNGIARAEHWTDPANLAQLHAVQEFVRGDLHLQTPAEMQKDYRGDVLLGSIQHQLGLDGKPTIVDPAQMNDAVHHGAFEGFRGISDPVHAESLASGAFHPGMGQDANGMHLYLTLKNPDRYASDGFNGAAEYAGKRGQVVRLALKSGARVTTMSAVQRAISSTTKQVNAYYTSRHAAANDETERANLTKEQDAILQVISDPGRMAALMGYDAMDTGGAGLTLAQIRNPAPNNEAGNTMVVVNRTALLIQRPFYTSTDAEKHAADRALPDKAPMKATTKGAGRAKRIQEADVLHPFYQRLRSLQAAAILYPDEMRYAGQTVIYGAGHKIIGNIGNGAGIKAEAQLHYGVHGKSTPEALQAKAQKATTTLTTADRTAMTNRRDELIQLAATSKDPAEQAAARDGAIILQRQIARYDETHPHETSARLQQEAAAKGQPLPKEATPQKTLNLVPQAEADAVHMGPNEDMSGDYAKKLVQLFGEHQLGAALDGYTVASLKVAATDLGIDKPPSSRRELVTAITAKVTQGRYSANFATPKAKASPAAKASKSATTAMPKTHGKTMAEKIQENTLHLNPIVAPDELHLGPDDKPSAFVLQRLYGNDQLPEALKGYTVATLRDMAKEVQKENPGTKPASLSKRADLTKYLVKTVSNSKPKTNAELDTLKAQRATVPSLHRLRASIAILPQANGVLR